MSTTTEEKRTVVTPGGRVGNDARHGSRSNGTNWVERTKKGELPRYIRIVRNGLMKDGHSEGAATALAVAAMKRWAHGGDDVSPKVQAAAAKAVAEWEAMKAEKSAYSELFEFKWGVYLDIEMKKRYDAKKRKEAAKTGHALPDGSFPIYDKEDCENAVHLLGHATDKGKAKAHIKKWAGKLGYVLPDDFDEKSFETDYAVLFEAMDNDVPEGEFKDAVPDTLLCVLHDHIDDTEEQTETKDGNMELEFKTVGVQGLNVEDEEKGIVTTFVSVTELRDNVKDIIHAGAYQKSLATRIPKGVWSHAWDTPVSKTLEVDELMPGSKELPKNMPNGDPWPTGAGALKVKTQFNLDTQRGREAYSDVVFFGDQQEWSIGYQVPAGGARIDKKTGIRHIDYLELYEYSPVLFGAMPAARTESVKDAQVAYKSITMTTNDFKEWADELGVEYKGFGGAGEGCGCDDPTCTDPSKHEKADPAAEPAGDVTDPEHKEHPAAEDPDDPEEKADSLDFTAYEYEWLVKAHDAIGEAIDNYEADLAAQFKVEEHEEKGIGDIVDANTEALGDLVEEMKSAADAFDTAYDLEDTKGMEEFGGDLLDLVEKGLEDSEDNALTTALHKVAAAVASMAPDDEEEDEGGEGEDPENPEDEDDTEKKKPKSIPRRPGKKADPIRMETKDWDALKARVLHK